MNNRAMKPFFVGMILILFFTVGLIFFLRTMFEKTETMIPEERCRITVDRETALNLALARADKDTAHTSSDFASNIKCKTVFHTITEKDETKLLGLVMHLMERCGEMFGEGKREHFSRDENTFCHICYSATFKEARSLPLKTALEKRKPKMAYDVPDVLDTGNQQGIIYYFERAENGFNAKIRVRAVNDHDMLIGCGVVPSQKV